MLEASFPLGMDVECCLRVSVLLFAEAHSREDVFQAFITGCH